MISKINLFIFTGLLISHGTSGLKCYQCQLRDGVGDEDCDANPPPEKYLTECAQPQCWLNYSNNGSVHIERFCVAMYSNMNGCMTSMVMDSGSHLHSGLECKCSKKDGCNGYTPNSERKNRRRMWNTISSMYS